jgi:hypothetical protein
MQKFNDFIDKVKYSTHTHGATLGWYLLLVLVAWLYWVAV